VRYRLGLCGGAGGDGNCAGPAPLSRFLQAGNYLLPTTAKTLCLYSPLKYEYLRWMSGLFSNCVLSDLSLLRDAELFPNDLKAAKEGPDVCLLQPILLRLL